MRRIVLFSLLTALIGACGTQRAADTTIHATISTTTGRLLLGGRINHLPVYYGSRDRFFDLIGKTGVPQPADKRLMLIALYRRTGEVQKYRLLSQSPDDQSWRIVTMFDPEPFPVGYRWEGRKTVMLLPGGSARTFRLVDRKKSADEWVEVK